MEGFIPTYPVHVAVENGRTESGETEFSNPLSAILENEAVEVTCLPIFTERHHLEVYLKAAAEAGQLTGKIVVMEIATPAKLRHFLKRIDQSVITHAAFDPKAAGTRKDWIWEIDELVELLRLPKKG